MAEKKKKTIASRTTNSAKNSSKKNTNTTKEQGSGEQKIPTRLISSSVFLGLFILFIVVFFNSNGLFPEMIEKLVHGLFGRVGFVVSISAFLYLFVIHAFSKGRPVKVRSICIGCFVVVCGCISHLLLAKSQSADVYMSLSELYLGGIDHTSGGVVCGGISMLIYYFFNNPLSYVVLIIAAVLTLLGGMQITVISIILMTYNHLHFTDEKTVSQR